MGQIHWYHRKLLIQTKCACNVYFTWDTEKHIICAGHLCSQNNPCQHQFRLQAVPNAVSHIFFSLFSLPILFWQSVVSSVSCLALFLLLSLIIITRVLFPSTSHTCLSVQECFPLSVCLSICAYELPVKPGFLCLVDFVLFGLFRQLY